MPRWPKKNRPCRKEGCTALGASTHGYCRSHRPDRARKHGPCSEAGCGKPGVAKGRCWGHYRAWLRTCQVSGCSARAVAGRLCMEHLASFLELT